MWRTRVGYAGGAKESPTYHAIGDHSECVEVDYDPTVVSYDELLDRFWSGHDATSRPFSNQYASLILVRDGSQLRAARASLELYEKATGHKVFTTIEKLGRFYSAEDYHQKYYLRNTPQIVREFEAMYASDTDFTASTAAARVNGYLGATGGDDDRLAGEIGLYGLSESSRTDLLERTGQAGYCAPVTSRTSSEPNPSELR